MSKELQDAFRQLRSSNGNAFAAEVVDVDKDNGICTVLYNGLEYTEVRLSAVVKERNDVFYLFPVPGSWVIVSPIGGDRHNLFVVACSEVDALKMVSGLAEMQVRPEGFKIARANESLKKLTDDLHSDLKDLCDYVRQTATVAGAAQVVPLATALKTKFEMIYPERVNSLLNDD